MTGSHDLVFIRDLRNINDRLQIIQQQISTPALAPEAKPAGKPGKAHQRPLNGLQVPDTPEQVRWVERFAATHKNSFIIRIP